VSPDGMQFDGPIERVDRRRVVSPDGHNPR
jgi:hypothetical protein